VKKRVNNLVRARVRKRTWDHVIDRVDGPLETLIENCVRFGRGSNVCYFVGSHIEELMGSRKTNKMKEPVKILARRARTWDRVAGSVEDHVANRVVNLEVRVMGLVWGCVWFPVRRSMG